MCDLSLVPVSLNKTFSLNIVKRLVPGEGEQCGGGRKIGGVGVLDSTNFNRSEVGTLFVNRTTD